MLKNKGFLILFLITGIILMIISCFISHPALSGISIGIGAGLFGMSLAQLYMLRYETKHPELMKQNEIEFKDERSTMIRHKAKALAGDIVSWLIMGFGFILIMVDAPLWITIICFIISIAYTFIGLYLMTKYDKEL